MTDSETEARIGELEREIAVMKSRQIDDIGRHRRNVNDSMLAFGNIIDEMRMMYVSINQTIQTLQIINNHLDGKNTPQEAFAEYQCLLRLQSNDADIPEFFEMNDDYFKASIGYLEGEFQRLLSLSYGF